MSLNPRRSIQRHRRNQRRHQRWLASFTYVTAATLTHLALEALSRRPIIISGTYGDWP